MKKSFTKLQKIHKEDYSYGSTRKENKNLKRKRRHTLKNRIDEILRKE